MNQEQLKNIIKRFRDSDFTSLSDNKENNYRRQTAVKEHHFTKQQFNTLRRTVKSLEQTIESLITDGNRAFRYYQELINQSLQQFQSFKQEQTQNKVSMAEEKKETESLIEFLNSKILTLNRQIASKEEVYREVLQKYEELVQLAKQAYSEQQQKIVQIKKLHIRQSLHYQENIITNSKEIEELKKINEQQSLSIDNLQLENANLRHLNEQLIENIEYLKNKIDYEKFIIADRISENQSAFDELERCDVESIDKVEERFTLEEIKMNESQEMNFNDKEVLNLSEHYSKFNRTHEYLSKQKSHYEFVNLDSNGSKSFIRKRSREIIPQNKNDLIKINTIQSRNEDSKKIGQILITEIKEFKMQQAATLENVTIDPYRAFFTLLIQCEKMNSPYFQRISHLDISYLYKQLLQQYIPYNLWQNQIKNTLQMKATKNLK